MIAMSAVDESEKTTEEQLGPWLRRQREMAGKTRKQLAAAVSIHPVQLARIETGESGTRKDTLDALISELSLDAKEAYIKAGFWPPDKVRAESASCDKIRERETHAADQLADIVRESALLDAEGRATALRLIRALKPETQADRDFELVDSDKAEPSEKDRPEEYEDLN